MQPRIHVITLAVGDLDRALAFYRDGLGLESAGVIGAEFVGDETNPAGAAAGSSSPYIRAQSWRRTRISPSNHRNPASSASATLSPVRSPWMRCWPRLPQPAPP
jgi:catechol 2,3-dioxygenase-like lactoylglutathione lyase family enzyme